MVEISWLGVGMGASLTLIAVAMHYARGTGWAAGADITDAVLETRAASVPAVAFPEPMNRSIGGGAVPVDAGGAESGAVDDAEPAGALGPAAIPDEEAATYEVTFEREGETLAVRENQTILEAGEDAGMELPYSCRQGQCISCAGHITDGGNAEEYVIHDTQEMLEDTELEEGYTLTCVAYPTRDLSIEAGEAP